MPIDRYTPLSPGEMTRIVRLQTPTTIIDGYGAREAWTDLTMVYAKIEPLEGRELFAAGAEQNPATMRIAILWRPNLTAQLRVISDGVTYELVAAPIDVHGERQSLDLMCKEVVS